MDDQNIKTGFLPETEQTREIMEDLIQQPSVYLHLLESGDAKYQGKVLYW